MRSSYERNESRLEAGAWVLAIILMAVLFVSCTSVVYVPVTADPVPASSPEPQTQTVNICKSVAKSEGACHKTSEDVYLTQVAAAQAAVPAELLFKDEIRNGPAYIEAVIEGLRRQGLCAYVYHEEEIAVWSKADQSFSENWDIIAEPGDGRILPRTGPGAHEWTCNPATTESGL